MQRGDKGIVNSAEQEFSFKGHTLEPVDNKGTYLVHYVVRTSAGEAPPRRQITTQETGNAAAAGHGKKRERLTASARETGQP